MGLDVYLYKYENKEDTDRRESQYESMSEKNWNDAGKYESLTQEQKDSVSAKNKMAAQSFGLSDYGSDETQKTKIEIDSKIDPQHYFKIGYFRSSYNGGGINRVLSNLDIPDLYDIFQPNDEYCFRPDWAASLSRLEDAIAKLKTAGCYACFDVSSNIFGNDGLPQSEKEAMDLFKKEIVGNSGFEQYSNNVGHFYHKSPLKILALIPGEKSILGKRECVYVITENENGWYLTALEIVRETIEWVLSQLDKEKYYLHWSS